MAQHVANPSHNEPELHASASRWRHQESSSYLRHTGEQTRYPTGVGATGELADFNKSRVEPTGDGHGGGNHRPITLKLDYERSKGQNGSTTPHDGRMIVCGLLLNYRRMDEHQWYGSVLIVVQGGGQHELYQPRLTLQRAGLGTHAPSTKGGSQSRDHDEAQAASQTSVEPQRLYSDERNTFWAFDIAVPLGGEQIKYQYEIPEMRFSIKDKPQVNSFFVPAVDESMRIMFHSCNGFSVGTDEEAFSGAVLWQNVMRRHQQAPFHVMIGGRDQIYNDGIRVNGPLRAWVDIGNPRKRREFPFPEKLRVDCDDFYLKNYIRWYNSEPFASANGQIPQINIWDDHDIIDGFGSYVDHFMRCDVFRGIGGTAHRYYMLFQHHLPPPASTYTSDNLDSNGESAGLDPNQLIDTFVAAPKADQQYIIGTQPGPYVAEHSFNIYCRLGARIAFVGIDARTERTRHQVNYPETYDLIFQRLHNELRAAAASSRPIQYLILLLGIPIAYPRLTWLENVLRSPVIGPIKFLNRRFGLGGGLFNHLDGRVDLLDDLDDHYTAKTHKLERLRLIERLQHTAAEFSVRVTILGGDVHLAALGRFYSKSKLHIPIERDHRYMANVVSSAIVNKPPPQAVANLLARRNKIHHLNHDTDETLLDLFDKDPGDSNKTANQNHCTMPSRNYAILTENSPNASISQANGNHQSATNNVPADAFLGRDGHCHLHQGEVDAGTRHKAVQTDAIGRGNDGSLDICINVEIDQHDAEGRTQAYGLTVPLLRCEKQAHAATATNQPAQ